MSNELLGINKASVDFTREVKDAHSRMKGGHAGSLDIIPIDFIEFNELIGLPRHPFTFKPHCMTKAQLDYVGSFGTHHIKTHLNKARQCGWTELILRWLAHQSFFKYAGKKIIIIPGTRQQTTKQIFARFLGLFVKIRSHIAEVGQLYIKLKNGTEIFGLPANPEAITGWTKIGAVFMDEAAKWDLTDDQPVLNAIMPIVRTNKSDVFMISTPKGPRGFFYYIEMDGKSTFDKKIVDIHLGGEELYTQEQIQEMLNSSEEDPAQEYLNQYTSGRSSIFGSDFKQEEYVAEW